MGGLTILSKDLEVNLPGLLRLAGYTDPRLAVVRYGHALSEHDTSAAQAFQKLIYRQRAQDQPV